MQNTEHLEEIIPLVQACMRFCRACLIFKFFRGEENLQSIHAKRVDIESNILDDYLASLKR